MWKFRTGVQKGGEVGAELTQSRRVDGLDRFLHLVQNAAVHIQRLNTDTERHTGTERLGKELTGLVKKKQPNKNYHFINYRLTV